MLAAAVIAAAAGRAWLLRRRHARLARDARLVTLLPPPEVDPAGGQALWSNLTGLLRPPWRRLLDGQPHLAFEYAWSPAGVRISLWVPGTIPPGLIERAAEAAWPGTRTQVTPAAPPIAAGACAEAGQLRLSRPDHYPLRSDHDADPLRALFAAGAVLAAGDSALVQVLARPVTGRRLLLARRAAAQLRGGQPARLMSQLLDLLTPGPAAPARPQAASQAYPDRAAEIRAILDKAAHPRWAVAIRYAVATAATGAPVPPPRQRLRGRAHALASAFALYTGHNQLVRRRLRRPASALNARRLGRGQLLSVPELAAIAHLPLDPAVPGLARAGARVVVPPPGIPRPGPDAKPLGETDAGIPRPVALRVADASSPPARLRRHRGRQVHADRQHGAGRRHRRAGRDRHRPQGRPDHRSSPAPARARRGQDRPVRPGRRRAAARAECAGRPGRRPDRRSSRRHLPPDLRQVLGAADRRRAAQRLPDPGRPARRHARRHPPAARRGRLPRAASPPPSRTRSCVASGTGTTNCQTRTARTSPGR